jgi:hypothetical protein
LFYFDGGASISIDSLERIDQDFDEVCHLCFILDDKINIFLLKLQREALPSEE